MSAGNWHLYLVHDADDPPGEGFFAYSHTDPVLGEMIYPVIPAEWQYFAHSIDLYTARYYHNQPLDNVRLALYLGYPAED